LCQPGGGSMINYPNTAENMKNLRPGHEEDYENVLLHKNTRKSYGLYDPVKALKGDR
jgi:hypothetical protein